MQELSIFFPFPFSFLKTLWPNLEFLKWSVMVNPGEEGGKCRSLSKCIQADTEERGSGRTVWAWRPHWPIYCQHGTQRVGFWDCLDTRAHMHTHAHTHTHTRTRTHTLLLMGERERESERDDVLLLPSGPGPDRIRSGRWVSGLL